jgi:predicted TIM-barrel fold metal-dependent hydrolase
MKLPLSDESKKKILWDNWAKLYGFDVETAAATGGK